MDAWKEKGNAIHANLKQEDEKMIKRMLFFWETMPAVEAGYEPWYFEAGKEFAIGEIVPQDLKEATKWFRLAAEQGETGAMFGLGACYLEGAGVKKDKGEALKWFEKAAALGHERSAKMLKKLQKESAR